MLSIFHTNPKYLEMEYEKLSNAFAIYPNLSFSSIVTPHPNKQTSNNKC